MSMFSRFNKKDGDSARKSSSKKEVAAAADTFDEDMDLSAAKTAIRGKSMEDWTQAEVLGWLETIDLHEHKANFWTNKITGSELPTLTEDDMKSLGVTKIGQRKKLAKEISKQATADATSNSASTGTKSQSKANANDSETSEDASGSSTNGPVNVTLKLVNGKDIRALRVPMSITFSELRRSIKELFGHRMRLKYKDDDGDYVSIRRQQDLLDMFSDMQLEGRTRQRIFVSASKESNEAAEAESDAKAKAVFAMFDVLLDAIIVINDEGIIQYCNSSFEKLTGYSSKEVISKNVTVIMTEEYKRTHDAYLKTYLRTRTSKIIGVGRDIVFQRKDGSVGTLFLEVTEKLIGDKSYFFGTMKKPVETQTRSVLQIEREVLDRLMVPAVIIDGRGTIHGFNQAASQLLGYQLVDVVGRNVNMLMTGIDKQNHDQYLKRYIETGKSKIIGIGRKVVAQTKDGSLKPVMLSVTEKVDGENRFFTGLMQSPDQ